MPNQNRPMTQAVNKDVESKRLPKEYFIGKGMARSDSDLQLQNDIWTFLKEIPDFPISEIEIDIADGVVTLMGTICDDQLQARVVHQIMRIAGVEKVIDQMHCMQRQPQKNNFDEVAE